MFSKNIIIVILIISNVLLLFFLLNKKLRHNIAKQIFPEKYKISNQDGYKRRLSIINSISIKPYQSVFAGHSQVKEFPLDAYFEGQILNMGVNAETIDGLNMWLPEKIRKDLPKKLFIQIGINDLLSKKRVTSLISSYQKLLDNCLLHIKSNNIYLCSVLPVNKNNKTVNKNIIRFNAELKNLTLTKSVNYIPLYQDFVNNRILKEKFDSGDGLHLRPSAYLKLSLVLKKYL